MTNHITADGLLAVDQCTRPMRYRDKQIIVQDTCLPEPRIGLTILEDSGETAHFDDSGDAAYLELDVIRATRLRDALDAFLQTSKGTASWRYDGVHYDLSKAWEGRPGTDYAGIWFRYTGSMVKDVPWMRAERAPGQTIHATLATVLGLKPCVVHGIYSAPCHACIMDNVRGQLRGDETADLAGVAYGEGFEPRGDQR